MSKYKLIILAVVTLLAGFLAGFLLGGKSEVVKAEKQVVTTSTGEVKEIGKPALIYFFAKDCSSCQKFKPNWLVLKRKYKDKFNFIEIDVDNQMNAPLCIEFMINVIPQVYLEDAPFRNRVFINPIMYHYMPRFQDELNRYLQMREILKKGVS
ncbi:MAG: thioredoxin domain-containing protein [Fusobacterium sp.]|nr:thioredoxin domain-containing protein [Fusobacterium sp.]